MNTAVADYLAARLDPHTVLVVLTPVPGDALTMLRQGLVWDASYNAGRLLGDVGADDLLAAGHHDCARTWLELEHQTDTALYRLLTGHEIGADERATLDFRARLQLALADCGAGRTPLPTEVAALQAAGAAEDDSGRLDQLQRCLRGESAVEPPSATAPVVALDDDVKIDIYDFIRSGDHAGCLSRLQRWVHLAEGSTAPGSDWAQIAEMQLFLTDDVQTAMTHLQRIPFAAAREDLETLFGAVGRARIDREKATVLRVIEAAFDGVPFPGRNRRTLYEAEAADSYFVNDPPAEHEGRWQDLPRQHILDCQWALPHLDEHGLQYYLAAIMSFAVNEHAEPHDDHGSGWIFESLGYHLAFERGKDPIASRTARKHSRFSAAQLEAVARFARFYGVANTDVRGWRKLALAARNTGGTEQ